MKIVIAGAGEVGFHLAELLSYENQDIVLIDEDKEVLDYVSSRLDILPIKGDSASIETLKRAQTGAAQLVLAVTTSEKTNILTAALAKQLGAKKVVARVQSQEYLGDLQLGLFQSMGIDHLISPTNLASKEIFRLVDRGYFTDLFEFEQGVINLVGVTLEKDSYGLGQNFEQLQELLETRARHILPIAVLRDKKTLFSSDGFKLQSGDHLYLFAPNTEVDFLKGVLTNQNKKPKNIMIAGGNNLSFQAAEMLQSKYQVKIIESNKLRAKLLAEKLQDTLIIHGNPSNIELLIEEGLHHMDVFIALTSNSETNIITCLMAKNHNVDRTIALVENKEFTHISQNIGVDTLINKKLIAANNIFRFIRKGHIEAITSLSGVDAEVIEYIIDKENQLTRKKLGDLHFPTSAYIGGVIRGENSLFVNQELQLKKGDKVIVFSKPESIDRLEQMFR